MKLSLVLTILSLNVSINKIAAADEPISDLSKGRDCAQAFLTSPWQEGPRARLRLIEGKLLFSHQEPGEKCHLGIDTEGLTYQAGVEIVLEPHTITYWRYPGAAGLAPNFSFEGSINVADVDVLFPAPKRFIKDGYESFGYEHKVIFPLKISPQDPDKPINLKVQVEYATCERLCASGKADLSLSLPYLDSSPSASKLEENRVEKTSASLSECESSKEPLPDSPEAERYFPLLPSSIRASEFTIRSRNEKGRIYWQILPKRKALAEALKGAQVFVESLLSFRGEVTWVFSALELLGEPPFPFQLMLSRPPAEDIPDHFIPLRLTFVNEGSARQVEFILDLPQ